MEAGEIVVFGGVIKGGSYEETERNLFSYEQCQQLG